jgi:hypothetical protein
MPLGYYCPRGSRSGTSLACDSPVFYCPLQSSAPLLTPEGSFSIPLGGPFTNFTTCLPGNYCVGGVSSPCPHLTYSEANQSSCSSCIPGTFYFLIILASIVLLALTALTERLKYVLQVHFQQLANRIVRLVCLELMH